MFKHKLTTRVYDLILQRQEQLALGYFMYFPYHDQSVIAAFRNDYVHAYTVLKFDYEKGIRWRVECLTPQDTIEVLRRFAGITKWEVLPKSAFWRNIPLEIAIILKSEAIYDILTEHGLSTILEYFKDDLCP